MHRFGRPRVDAAIAGLAGRQHGVVSLTQLVELGLSVDAVQWRVRVGRLHRVHHEVYAVGHPRLTQRGRWMAAVLAGGDGAVLSHRSAAALWRMLPPPARIHVTVRKPRRKRDGIEFHSQPMPFDELTTLDGIPTTTPARTLLDLAASDPKHFERAFKEADYLRLDDPVGLPTLLARYPGRRGTRLVAKVLEDPSQGRTREELEAAFKAFIDEHDLPRPAFNADVELTPGHWIQPDCLWRDARLIAELDSRRAHNTRSRFETDRERDRKLALLGFVVVRITWRHLKTDRAALARDIAELLSVRGRTRAHASR